MKAFKLSNLLIISLALFFFGGCAKIISSKTESVSEEQKAVEKQIMTFFTSLTEAPSQKNWAKLNRIVDEYFAEYIIIRVENPNQGIQAVTLQQYRFLLRTAPEEIIDYKHKYKNIKVEVAQDCKSAEVTAGQLLTITMKRRRAFMAFPYLFKDYDIPNNEPQVTIKIKGEITMMFEYREGKLLLIWIDLKVIKVELI
ncbi:MAG: hypothetical protein ISS66_04050 [Desulfobacteraceae bacterium]|nr:hypothetical protein [Desulfobacteraceae bacterium]